MNHSLDVREAQANACLQQACTLRLELPRYARKLSNGNDEEAQELVGKLATAPGW